MLQKCLLLTQKVTATVCIKHIDIPWPANEYLLTPVCQCALCMRALCDTCVVLAWYVCGTCVVLAWYLRSSFVVLAWFLHGSCMVLAWYLHGSGVVSMYYLPWQTNTVSPKTCLSGAICIVLANSPSIPKVVTV